jgi:hypothetical protein
MVIVLPDTETVGHEQVVVSAVFVTVYGAVPPLMAIVALYVLPIVAVGKMVEGVRLMADVPKPGINAYTPVTPADTP